MQCASCEKYSEIGEPFYPVLRSLPIGEQEEIYVCASCKPSFGKIEILHKRLNGPTYTYENRPTFWSNGTALHYEHYHVAHSQLFYLYNELPLINPEKYAHFVKENVLDTKQLPLATFPLIEDFEVILEGITAKHRREDETITYYVWLFSPSRGYLAHFLDEDKLEDLCQDNFIIPHGDFNTPYAELDQAWHILMAENEEFVYILTGNWEKDEGYTTWFKVEKSFYYSQWKKAIQLCRLMATQAP